MVRKLVLAAALLMLPWFAFADEWAERMDAIFLPALDAGTYAGASVVVVVDRKIAFIKGYGVADAENRAFGLATRSYLGSVSKSFVGLLIVQLAAAGKLDLDAPVQTYLPEFKLASDASAITVRQLLTHTSGLSQYTGNRNQNDQDQTAGGLRSTVAELANWSLDTEPATRFDYSNANYQVLGRLIEVLTDKPFAQAIQERVFNPLNMTASRIMHDYTHPDSADGFRFWGSIMIAHQEPMGISLMPQGGVSSSIQDMARYLIGLMGGDLVTPGVWHSELAESHGLNGQVAYGAGWFVHDKGDDLLLLHHGLNGGFTASAAFKPHADQGVAVMVNTGDGFLTGDVSWLHNQAMHTVFPELPAAVAVNYTERWLQLIGILAVFMGLLLWILTVARNGIPSSHFALRLILPTGLLFAVAYALGVWLPSLFGIPLTGIAVFNPDIGLLLTLTTGVSIVWAVVRIGVLVWTQRSR